ncbi:MAG: acyltransferase family protein [Micrococcaceae bacterium]
MEQQITPMKSATRSQKRILGLDGLRAIAVLSVVFYHFNSSFPKGGYIGVDIFFVISGFLITTLLVNEYYKYGRINFKAFWIRRARRLLPALFTVILISVFFALISFFFFRGHDLLIGIGRQTLGALTFSNNWLEIYKGTSYFNNDSPLLFVNFWSLAVEEQFYLVWPFVVLIILSKTVTAQYNAQKRAAIAAVLGIISAVLMAVIYVPGGDPTRVYYGTDTHIFGLMFGACLAFIHTNPWYEVRRASPLTHSWYRRIRVLLAIGCFVVLFYYIFNLSSKETFTYRGGLVIVSLLSAGIISALPGPMNIVSLILESKVLKWVGERSYGIYLWHWPIILILGSMLPVVSHDKYNWLLLIVALPLTLLFSAFSYTYLETPIRVHGFNWLWDKAQGLFTRSKAKFLGLALIPIVLLGSLVTSLYVAPTKTQSQILIEQAEAQAKKAQEAAAAAAQAAAQAKNNNLQEQYEQIKAQALAQGLPAPPPPDVRPGVPTGDQISALGDSVMLASSQELISTFPGIDIDASVGREAAEGVSDFEQKLQAGSLRANVVVAIGTNGAITADQLNEIISDAGTRRVVLVHAYGLRDWIQGNNQLMDAAAAAHKNVAVANWDGDIANHLDLLAEDGIHPGPSGGAIYAKSVADAFVEINNKMK